MNMTEDFDKTYRALRQNSPFYDLKHDRWQIADYDNVAHLMHTLPPDIRLCPHPITHPHTVTSAFKTMLNRIKAYNRGDLISDLLQPFVALFFSARVNNIIAQTDGLVSQVLSGEIPKNDALCTLMVAYRLRQREAIVLLKRMIERELFIALIGGGLVALLCHPKQRVTVSIHPEKVNCALAEITRYSPPQNRVCITAKHDVIVSNHHIRKGERIELIIAAANRDTERYRNADIFDMNRRFKSAPLVYYPRLLTYWQVETLLRLLFEYLPDVRLLLPPSEIAYAPSSVIRRPLSVPLKW